MVHQLKDKITAIVAMLAPQTMHDTDIFTTHQQHNLPWWGNMWQHTCHETKGPILMFATTVETGQDDIVYVKEEDIAHLLPQCLVKALL